LITKLRQFGFIAEEDGFFLRYRGYIAIAYIVGIILHALHGKTYEMTELAQILYDKGFCLGGRDKVFSYHEKLVGRFLEDLTRLQLLKYDNSKYSVSEEDERCRFACNCLSKIIDLGSLHSKSELEETIECFRSNLALEKFSIGYLMEKLSSSTLGRAKSILSSSSSSDKFFLNSLKTKQKKAISEKDMLASAAYWQLSASIYEEEGNLEKLDFCKSRSFISLAIFWKYNNDLTRAAKYYEKASEIMSRYPRYSKNAMLQLANSLECKGKNSVNEGNFGEASAFYTKASELFSNLGMDKESTFCKFRNLESQARENAFREEFLVASELMNKAALVIKGAIEKYYWSCLAYAKVYEARHLEKVEDFQEASKCHVEASRLFEKAGLSNASSVSRAHSLQCKAFFLRNSRAPYKDIAEACLEAANCYAEVQAIEAAKVCEADSLKYQGLDAVQKANWADAISLFEKGRMICRELAFYCGDPFKRDSYETGATWFEAMRMEAMADEKLITTINKKGDLSEVAKLLAHAADLFTRVGDYKHAEIDSSFMIIAMAIDAFHKGDVVNANSLLQEAKRRLPEDFVFSILEDKVKVGWQPLRYTVGIMKDFDAYARKIETEKGFSFESRMRELIRKILPQYDKIEPKTFQPEEDEIGIVFKDSSPIEIDAVGTREQTDNLFMLVAEIKNISKPVGRQDMALFLRKLEFIEKRYSKITKLQGLKKHIIENKLFMSISGFDFDAKTLAEKNNIKIYDKAEINELLKKHHMFRVLG
jgi:hypothetical protein